MPNINLPEGEVLNRYIKNRMIKRNQNVLLAVTGGTGSGKSYDCLQMCDLWYKYYFKKPFPIENVAFSIDDIIRALNSGKLKRGELLILEEGGVLLNSLDFQNKMVKMFTFVLQSFRSMNIGIIINLPVLTMLNKSTRLLLHGHFVTCGIDYVKQQCKLKPKFHQLNQATGKSYWKYIRVYIKGKRRSIEKFNYSIPRKELREAYEKRKARFVSGLNADFVKELEHKDVEEKMKEARKLLTQTQQQVYEMIIKGKNIKEIAQKRDVNPRSIYDIVELIKKKGFEVKIARKSQEIEEIEVQT